MIRPLQKLSCQRHFDAEAIKERATHALLLATLSDRKCKTNLNAPRAPTKHHPPSSSCVPFIDEKDICNSEMKLLSSWPLTHYLYSQRSLTFTLPQPFSTFTRPCARSAYCNRIQHAALQAADKPAQGQLPTLATIINRLFTRAYQSLFPLCVWERVDVVQLARK